MTLEYLLKVRDTAIQILYELFTRRKISKRKIKKPHKNCLQMLLLFKLSFKVDGMSYTVRSVDEEIVSYILTGDN